MAAGNGVELEKVKAYEYYYNLGARRTMRKVADKFSRSTTTIWNWSKKADWTKRIVDRDDRLAGKIADMSEESILKEHNEMITETAKLRRAAFDLLEKAIAEARKKGKGIAQILDIKDFRDAITAYKDVVKMQLLLNGEPTDISKGDFTLQRLIENEASLPQAETIIKRYQQKYPCRDMDKGHAGDNFMGETS